MRFFVRDASFYQKSAKIAIPITLQSVITIGVNVADTMMVGMLGDAPLAAVGQAGQFVNIFSICCMGLGMGASVLTARYWGQKDITNMKKAYSIMLRLCLILATVFFMIPTAFFPRGVMELYTDDPDLVEQRILYLKWMVPCFLFQGLSLTSTQVLRSLGQTLIPMISSVGAFAINVLLNYILIFGHFGAPAMGIEGAAIATFIARIFEFLFICGYIFVFDKRMHYRFNDLIMKCSDLVGTYLKICIPVFVSDTLLGLGNSAVAMVMGRISKEFVAANSLTVMTQQVSTIFIQGICHASSIITGQTLGEGKVQKAKDQAWTFLAMSAIVGLVGGIIIVLISKPTIAFYARTSDEISDTTMAIAQELMYSIAIIVLFQSMNSILTKGVLRGGGDTKFLMVADILFLWVLSVPLGAIAAFVFHLSPFWIYFFLKIDQIVKSVWCLFRLKSGKWIKKI